MCLMETAGSHHRRWLRIAITVVCAWPEMIQFPTGVLKWGLKVSVSSHHQPPLDCRVTWNHTVEPVSACRHCGLQRKPAAVGQSQRKRWFSRQRWFPSEGDGLWRSVAGSGWAALGWGAGRRRWISDKHEAPWPVSVRVWSSQRHLCNNTGQLHQLSLLKWSPTPPPLSCNWLTSRTSSWCKLKCLFWNFALKKQWTFCAVL